MEGNDGRPPIGEKLETANFVHDAGSRRRGHWFLKWSVTIKVREVGSRVGLDSSTRTVRPPRATWVAV